MYTHNFRIQVETERNLTRDDVHQLIRSILTVGQADAEETLEDESLGSMVLETATNAASLNFSIT